MEVATLLNQIKNKDLNDFYIFTGDEWKVQQIYIEQIAKAKNLEIKRINSINDIFAQVQNKSLLSAKFCFTALYDDALIHSEKLWDRIKSKIFGNHIYIVQLPTIDKRTKFYKRFKDEICVFEPLAPNTLKKYLAKEINLSQKNLETLMAVCEFDYGKCLLEIDKVKRFAEVTFPEVGNDWENNADYDGAFRTLLEEGAIYRPPKDAIFDFVDAVLRHDVNLALELLDECKKIGEATLAMLSVLFSNAKNVLQVCENKNDDVGGSTGLSTWEIKLARDRCGYYDAEYLVYMLRKIQQVEIGIKQGKIDDDIAMDYLLSVIL